MIDLRPYARIRTAPPVVPDPSRDPLDAAVFDEARHASSWNDMLRLQADGTYPAAFATIHVPVLMVHGEADLHPGQLIRAALAPHLPQLAYVELARCGHAPWTERQARGEFARVVRAWIAGFAPRGSR